MAYQAQERIISSPGEVITVMPYIDINPHRGRPKWVGYLVLAVLAALTVLVVVIALARG